MNAARQRGARPGGGPLSLSCRLDGLGPVRATAHPTGEGTWRVYYRDGSGREHLAFSSEAPDADALGAELELWARRQPGRLYYDAGITLANPDSLDVVFRLHARRGPGHDFFHVMRRLGVARTLARAERADLAVVECGCYLLGLADEAAATAVAALAVQGVADDVLDRARVAVDEVATTLEFAAAATQALQGSRLARHARRAESPGDLGLSTAEGQVLHDADVLENLGALGAVSALVAACAAGRDLHDAEAQVRQWLWVAHTVTRSGRRLERSRRQQMQSVLDAIARERAGQDLGRT